MATHDYVIANGTGAAVRSDLNNALAAIVSNNSSSSEPGTTYAYQWWADTNANVLKIRNSSNDGWITLRELDGTMLIEDGSASTPGLAFADDVNTGIFSPAADQIGFATGGAERLEIGNGEVVFNDPSNDVDFRVESNGETHMLFIDGGNDRVGIGTSSPSQKLQVTNGNILLDGTDQFIYLSSDADQWLSANSASNYMRFGTANQERLRLDSSGNFGIGTSTPSRDFHNASGVCLTTGAAPQYRLNGGAGDSNDNDRAIFGLATANSHFFGGAIPGDTVLRTTNGGNLLFGVGTTERMRIDGSGNVFINRTSQRSAEKFSVDNAGQVAIFACTTSADHSNIQMIHAYASGGTNATQFSFQNSTATQVGSIKSNGSSTSFNTSSDYRLKENVVDLDGAITRVKQLSPKRFNFIVNPETTVDGFLAHEAQTVVPEAITGEKDAVDADGNPEYQGIDQSKLVPLLTAALQEAIAKIETLETKVAALEAG